MTNAKTLDPRKKFWPTQKRLTHAKIYVTHATYVKIMTHVKKYREFNLHRKLCNSGTFRIQDIFRTLSNNYHGIFYWKFCVTLKSKHIQNPAKYLRRSILLRTLCNYSKCRRPIHSKLALIQNTSVSVTNVSAIF